MTKLDVVIVDDEPVAARRLARLLKDCADIVLAGTAGSATDAEELVARVSPDLVLLDIEMPGLNGIDLAEKLQSAPMAPSVIFTTAFSRFALDAFSVAATDYLLKPVEFQRLEEALERVRAHRSAREADERIRELEAIIQSLREAPGADEPDRNEALWLPSGGGQERVTVRSIVWIEAERDYVRVHASGRSYFARARIGQMESRLRRHGLVRIHRSAMVQPRAIARVESSPDRGYRLILADGTILQASRRFGSAVRELLVRSLPA